MTEYHTIYKGLPGETTKWDDIQRKLGNLPPLPPVWKPEKFAPEQEQVKDQAYVDARDEQELEEMEDDFSDDKFMEEYRRKRIEQIRRAALRPRFGTVELIRGSEFVQQVTNAGEQVWVVVHLFKESNAKCGLLGTCLEELAAKHPNTKFVKIISTDCIPNYPDANLPTLLVYNEGQCTQTIVGLNQFGGPRTTPEQVALVLNTYGPICRNPDEDEEQAAQAQVKGLVERLVAAKEGGLEAGAVREDGQDESSDFDD